MAWPIRTIPRYALGVIICSRVRHAAPVPGKH